MRCLKAWIDETVREGREEESGGVFEGKRGIVAVCPHCGHRVSLPFKYMADLRMTVSKRCPRCHKLFKAQIGKEGDGENRAIGGQREGTSKLV